MNKIVEKIDKLNEGAVNDRKMGESSHNIFGNLLESDKSGQNN